MPVIVGIALVPIVLTIIYSSNLITTQKRTRLVLNISLVLITILFIVFCCVAKAEPFDFGEDYSLAYMFFSGDYIIISAVIFVFTPFMWIVVIHFFGIFLRSLRIRKNAVIKRSGDYIYYRGDLDRVSPAILTFVSTLEVDIRKSITTTLLKLKLAGYIKESNGAYVCTDKKLPGLPESERMVFDLIRYHVFDKSAYKKVIEEEAVSSGYLTKNRGGIPLRIIKIMVAICIPVIAFAFSFWVDAYTFENYHVWPEDDGYVYFMLERDVDIERLYGQVTDINDYYHRDTEYGGDYNYREIRADKLQYGVARKAFFFNMLATASIWIAVASVIFALYRVIWQAVYINKNYRRTAEGKALLDKAYALKNYLKEYSRIIDRGEQELGLWEYYLIYAVALDVNVKVEDEVIEKYVKNIVLE